MKHTNGLAETRRLRPPAAAFAAVAALALGLAAYPASAEDAAPWSSPIPALADAFAPPEKTPFIQIIPHFEYGMLAVLFHQYQSGAAGTLFNFITQGGQDTLFPYQRYSMDVILAGQHHISFLYQPLTLSTSTVADRNNSNGGAPVVIDDVSFAPGTPMNVKYGFDFWRVSYLYDFIRDPATILGVGLSLQIRNASIVFASGDGTRSAIQQNIGPVPILKVRAAHWFSPFFGLDFEADGFYASSAFFNGSGQPFEGWIWDASLSAKTHFAPGAAAFATVRSIGGGAHGNNAYSYVSSTTSVNSATYNALATMAVTLGVSLE
jgi:hypothetical protein